MIDLQQFCAVGDLRIYLNSTWHYKGWHIASDGWMLVATHNELFSSPDTDGIPESTATVVDGILQFDPGARQGVPLSNIVFPQGAPCARCGTRGKVWTSFCPDLEEDWEICKNCDGEGYLYHAAPQGAGDKECTCKLCLGAGFGNCNDLMEITGYKFSAALVHRLKVLPELRFFVNDDGNANFVFADGVGALAGRRQ